MFCQACGKPVREDARFCNICGARIASPGTPGGLISPPKHVSPAPEGALPAATAPHSPAAKKLGTERESRATPPTAASTPDGAAFGVAAAGLGGTLGGAVLGGPREDVDAQADSAAGAAVAAVLPIQSRPIGTPKAAPSGGDGRTMMMGSKDAAQVEAAVRAAKAAATAGSIEAHDGGTPLAAGSGHDDAQAAGRRSSRPPGHLLSPAGARPDPTPVPREFPSSQALPRTRDFPSDAPGAPTRTPPSASGDSWVAAAASARPAVSMETSQVSLEAIGVEPSGRRWLRVLLAIAVVGALCLGALILVRTAADPREAENTENAKEGPNSASAIVGRPQRDDSPEAVDAVPSARGATAEDSSASNAPPERPPAPASTNRPGATGPAAEKRPSQSTPVVSPSTQATMTHATMTQASTTTPPQQETQPAPTPPPPAREPTTEVPEASDIEMNLYASRVRFTVSRYYAARAQTCFEHASLNEPDLRGRVVVALTIGAGGQVSRAAVTSNNTGNTALGQCLANRVASWRLPPPPDDEPVSLELPFSR